MGWGSIRGNLMMKSKGSWQKGMRMRVQIQMQKVQLTYRFRLYPKHEQEERLLETLEL